MKMRWIVPVLLWLVSSALFGPFLCTPDGQTQIVQALGFERWTDTHPPLPGMLVWLVDLAGFGPVAVIGLIGLLAWLLTSAIGGVPACLTVALLTPLAPQSVVFMKDLHMVVLLLALLAAARSRQMLVVAVLASAMPFVRHNAAPLSTAIFLWMACSSNRHGRRMVTFAVVGWLLTWGGLRFQRLHVAHDPVAGGQLWVVHAHWLQAGAAASPLPSITPSAVATAKAEVLSAPAGAFLAAELRRVADWVLAPSVYGVIPPSDAVFAPCTSVNRHVSPWLRGAAARYYVPSLLTVPLLWFALAALAAWRHRFRSMSWTPLAYLSTLLAGVPVYHVRFILPAMVACICLLLSETTKEKP